MPALESTDHMSIHDKDVASLVGAHAFKLRPYQLEMLNESMRRNLIIAVRYIMPFDVWDAKDNVDGHWLRQDFYVRNMILDGDRS